MAMRTVLCALINGPKQGRCLVTLLALEEAHQPVRALQ